MCRIWQEYLTAVEISTVDDSCEILIIRSIKGYVGLQGVCYFCFTRAS